MATATATVSTPDLSVTETETPSPAATGGNITYVETVINNSAAAAGGATLTQSSPFTGPLGAVPVALTLGEPAAQPSGGDALIGCAFA